MISAQRIVKAKYAETAFDGEGARKFGGRWNNKQVPLVYTSASLSLAALEILVHLNPPIYPEYVSIKIEFDSSLVETIKEQQMPPDWKQEPPAASTKQMGDRWYRNKRSAVLRVPSALIPDEWNYLLNKDHPDFTKIIIHPPKAFEIDARLVALKMPPSMETKMKKPPISS